VTKRWRLILLGLWAAGILFPMAWFSSLNPALDAWFNRTFQAGWVHIAAHAGLYAVLAFAIMRFLSTNRHARGIALFVVLCVGVMQELLQSRFAGVPFGSGALFDVMIDLGGGFVGIFANWVFSSKTKRAPDIGSEVARGEKM
jgi:hypothetical protein